jgi:tetratricopeptide (TPR) repeat protein
MPSTVGYMLVSGGLSFALFLLIWFWLRADGDEAPWIPAGLAAGFVVLIAAAAREIVMRRAWARYTREMELAMGGEGPRPVLKSAAGGQRQVAQSSAMRALQQRLAELDGAGAAPESHLEAFRLCEQFLANAEEAMRTASAAEMRAALRAGQERVRGHKRKHLLLWARGESTRLTHEAQRRVRAADKIETAQRALEVLDEALRLYPDARELRDSATAVRDFVASVKVGQWVEMAERAAFRGRYTRAIARYRDALFYLSRAEMGDEARHEAAARIQREIEMLRARLDTEDADDAGLSDPRSAPRTRARRKREVEAEAHPADEAEEAEL